MIPTKLKNIIYIYISLPFILFLINWLSLTNAILSSILFGIIFYKMFTEKEDELTKNTQKIKYIIPCCVIALLWVFLSGIGGYFYQTHDFNVRNAVLRDLINYKWPVTYTPTTVLNYYFGFWLPPVFITKFFTPFFSADILFKIGLHLLFLYSFLGISLFFLLLTNNGGKFKISKLYLCFLIPCFFGGLDCIANSYRLINIFSNPIDLDKFHIEWYTLEQYSSLTTCLFWVFNQCIIPWLCTLLFFMKRKIENYGFYLLICFFTAPLPAIGLFLLMAIHTALDFLIRPSKRYFTKILKKTFSLQNCLSLPLIIIMALFYSANGSSDNLGFRFSDLTFSDYILFILLEFLVFMVCIFPYYKKDPMFYTVLILLSTICCFHIGDRLDFAMRVSIPPILLLMVMILKCLQENKRNYKIIALYIALLFGAIAPLCEMSRGFISVARTKSIISLHDDFGTFSDKNYQLFPFDQYVLSNPKSQFFYKYLAKDSQ